MIRGRAQFHSAPSAALAILLLHGGTVAAAPEAFSPAPFDGGAPYFTIFLPEDWAMQRQGEPNARLEKFIFEPPQGQLPYLWVRVDRDPDAANRLLPGNAAEVPQRDLLSGGESKTDYFDLSREIYWRQSESGPATTTVTAAFPGDPTVTMSFFVRRAALPEYSPTMTTIIDNVRFYSGTAESPAAASADVDPHLFTRAPIHSRFRIDIIAAVALLIGGLFTGERWLRRQREKAAIAAIEREQQRRKTRVPPPHDQRDAADAYIRDTLDTYRKSGP